MNPNVRKFKIEYAQELLRLAVADLQAAKILLQGNARPESTLYHIEQVVEKSMKAVICHNRKPVPFTHDIGTLLIQLGLDLPPGGTALSDLTPFATIRRYEEGAAIIEPAEVALAIDLAEKVLRWAELKVVGLKS